MSIEVLVRGDADGPKSAWIASDAGYVQAVFLKHIAALTVEGIELIDECFGPAEYTHRVTTEFGAFTIRRTIDEWPGVTFLSEADECLEKLLAVMEASGEYHLRHLNAAAEL